MKDKIETLREKSKERVRHQFQADLKGDVEFGSLHVIQWRLSRQKVREASSGSDPFLSIAEKIVRRWAAIEADHGEGALLVEENKISQMLAAPGGRFAREPQLLENARALRALKGQEWWLREHQLDSLLELVQGQIDRPHSG